MKGKVTSKKLVEANKWLATINTNEKKLKFIVEKDMSCVCLNFYLRVERVYWSFVSMLRKKEKELLKDGWSIGKNNISYSSSDIFIYAAKCEDVSCIELQFKFNVGNDVFEAIQSRLNIIQRTIKMFEDSISDLKISMDVKYSAPKSISIPKEELISILDNLSYEKLKNTKLKYRKFEIMNRHNVTDKVEINNFDEHLNLDINIDVENIVVDKNNLKEEIEFSLYYFILEYAKLHYYILNTLDVDFLISQQEFYDKIKKEF